MLPIGAAPTPVASNKVVQVDINPRGLALHPFVELRHWHSTPVASNSVEAGGVNPRGLRAPGDRI